MRIITGKYRGRRLETPKNDKVRPTSDKVKEAIFSILFDEFYDGVVCDLFAGTGNLGIEALSRGAKRCYFADSSKDSISLVRQNLNACKIKDEAVVLAGDYISALNRIREKLTVIFLDPPYEAGFMLPAMQEIEKLELLEKEGTIVAEHSIFEELPDCLGKYEKIKEKRYGKIAISIYKYL